MKLLNLFTGFPELAIDCSYDETAVASECCTLKAARIDRTSLGPSGAIDWLGMVIDSQLREVTMLKISGRHFWDVRRCRENAKQGRLSVHSPKHVVRAVKFGSEIVR